MKGLKPIYGEVTCKPSRRKENLLDMMQNDELPNRVTEKDLLVIKPNFWTFGGNGYLQFSQNYISKNWYKGGESTKSLLSGFTWQANYDDRQRIQFENKIEWKLGLSRTFGYRTRYKANNDLLRLSSKLGYKPSVHGTILCRLSSRRSSSQTMRPTLITWFLLSSHRPN